MKPNKKSFLLQLSLLIILSARILFPSDKFVTNFSVGDGFGSQFQNIIAAAAYAELNDKIFLYTPFQAMEHNYDNDPLFLLKKELLINFIGNFELNTYSNIPVAYYKEFFDNNVSACIQTNAFKKIKTIFRENKNKSDYFDPQYFNIAIHVRRHNTHDSRETGTETPDKLFLNLLEIFRNKYHTRSLQFHIYTQGKIEEFAIFKANDVVFHINEATEDSFIGMVFADVLVSCASSFSYTAGLLSDGIVYYVPFWHTPLPHWISVNTILPTSNQYSYRAIYPEAIENEKASKTDSQSEKIDT